MSVIEINDKNFVKQVLEADGYILVDFWAEWCGPCKQLAPILEEVAKEMDKKIKFTKVNIDNNPETPTKYGVRGIPTMILIKDGELISTKVGALQKKQIIEWIATETSA